MCILPTTSSFSSLESGTAHMYPLNLTPPKISFSELIIVCPFSQSHLLHIRVAFAVHKHKSAAEMEKQKAFSSCTKFRIEIQAQARFQLLIGGVGGWLSGAVNGERNGE